MFSQARIPSSYFLDHQAPLEPIDPDDDYGKALWCLFSERYWRETADRQMRSDLRIYRLCPQMIPTIFEHRDKARVVARRLSPEQFWKQEIKHEDLAYNSDGLLPRRLTAMDEARKQKRKERNAAKERRCICKSRTARCW